MNCVARSGFLLGLAGIVAGCAHSKDEAEAELLRMERARPPAFLKSPAALLLTNTAGFIGRVKVENRPFSTSAGSSVPADKRRVLDERVAGELLGRGSKIFFVPDETSRRKRARNGGVSFIWDVTESKGYVLSEALQGFGKALNFPEMEFSPTSLQFTTSCE